MSEKTVAEAMEAVPSFVTQEAQRLAAVVQGRQHGGTLSLLCLAVIALLLKESWLIDVCLIYGMISFLAVAVLAMTQMGQKPGETDDEDMSDGKGGNA